ncbi:hypothetical protein [Paenibacillus taichungensis]
MGCKLDKLPNQQAEITVIPQITVNHDQINSDTVAKAFKAEIDKVVQIE